ncbi:hypothetical protein Q8A67_011377 [Cirrhinus molitorella]|uniref:Nucleolar and spindle-associated protein 1 n=1 Tax=Cirrhinus molitorella TaxID=172907 RepID=A0AA88TY02_9TELE|nr:hypothetical protein Q8A67_011377 [Cirrhinus molitorella]
MDLDSLKYAELQRLAKEVGLKANMKAEKLLNALKEHFSQQQQQTSENGNDAATTDAHDPVPVVDEQNAHTATFVTERRGKGRTAKRKLSDSTPVTAQAEEKPAQEEGRRGSKRRKVSSAKDAQTPVPPETSTKEDPVEKSGETNPDSEDASAEPSVKGVGRRTVGKIPRLEGLMKRKPALRPTTPNFKKLHEAHFKKMESIDSYVQRKNKQMEELKNSAKELKTLSEKTLMKSVERKAQTKVPASRVSLFSPGVQEKKTLAEKRRLTQQAANKSALKDSATFRPTVLTTNKINVRFSQTTHDNEYKRSLIKTPARMSPLVPLTSTPGRKSGVHTKPELNKSVGAIKTPGVTPFVFNGNNSMSATPGVTKKNTFDLKASLSRPLGYKPHKGKLKPFGAPQENTELNKSQTVPSHQKNYKQHQVQTREERRAKHTEDRKQKKEKMMGARRGLVMA